MNCCGHCVAANENGAARDIEMPAAIARRKTLPPSMDKGFIGKECIYENPYGLEPVAASLARIHDDRCEKDDAAASMR